MKKLFSLILILASVLTFTVFPQRAFAENESPAIISPSLPDIGSLFSAAVHNNIDACSVSIDGATEPLCGNTLTAVLSGQSAADAANAGNLKYVWQRETAAADDDSWEDIPGADGETYILTAEDIGYVIRVCAIAYGDFSGMDISESAGPVEKVPYSGDEPVQPVSASPTDLTITVKTEPEQEYVLVPYSDEDEVTAPSESQWQAAYRDPDAESSWRRFKGLRADTHYAIWTRFPGTSTQEASDPVYNEFRTTGNYLPGTDTVWSNGFTDVPSDSWYYSAVRFTCANRLLTGMSGSAFEPDTLTTRAMVVAVLWRMEDEPEYTGQVFADVPDGNWYSQAVAWAVDAGIVNGKTDELFRPNTPVTREELAAMLGRYALGRGFDTGDYSDLSAFSDSDTIPEYAQEYMKWAVGSGLITGTGEGLLEPKSNVSRAEFAVMLMRLLCDE